MTIIELKKKEKILLNNIKKKLSELRKFLEGLNECYEDVVYRFYHQSYKVSLYKPFISDAVELLESLSPLDYKYLEILKMSFQKIKINATGKDIFEACQKDKFSSKETVEAYFHIKYLFEMIVKYGQKLETPPEILPIGWAAVLYLYGLR